MPVYEASASNISVQSCLCLTGLKISEVNNLAMNFVKNLILADKMSQMVEINLLSNRLQFGQADYESHQS